MDSKATPKERSHCSFWKVRNNLPQLYSTAGNTSHVFIFQYFTSQVIARKHFQL